MTSVSGASLCEHDEDKDSRELTLIVINGHAELNSPTVRSSWN